MRVSLLLLAVFIFGGLASAAEKPNVLIITVDDMSCDSIGVFGCRMADTTPRIDALSTQCMRFTFAHSVVGNCMPSRNVMWSGRYPHNNHVEGFNPIPKEKVDYPVMGDLMHAGGWFTVVFEVPAEVPGDAVIFAGLVGDSIKDALQHVQTKPIRVK